MRGFTVRLRGLWTLEKTRVSFTGGIPWLSETSAIRRVVETVDASTAVQVIIPGMDLMVEIASDEVLGLAFNWLCERRKDYSANSDVWDVRWRWNDIKPVLQRMLLAGEYRFSPLRRIRRENDVLEIWSALDALVLKAMAIVLNRRLSFSNRCYHLKGHGGAKAAVRAVVENLPGSRFVFSTDVRSYYASINHDVFLGQLRERIDDSRLLDLLQQYIRRTVVEDGVYEDITCGISLGCALSPVMGALYLQMLDERMEATGLFYARFMDDWVILAPSRWKLRRALRIVNQTLAELRVEQHPDKTFVGRTCRGFSFLGYEFGPTGLTGVARPTRVKFVERVSRLYEQGATEGRIGDYVRRWQQWVRAGLPCSANWPVWLDDAFACGSPLIPRHLLPTL